MSRRWCEIRWTIRIRSWLSVPRCGGGRISYGRGGCVVDDAAAAIAAAAATSIVVILGAHCSCVMGE